MANSLLNVACEQENLNLEKLLQMPRTLYLINVIIGLIVSDSILEVLEMITNLNSYTLGGKNYYCSVTDKEITC